MPSRSPRPESTARHPEARAEQPATRGPWGGLSAPEILAAAVDAFADNGYPGTHLEDVAARLGVKRQAIYYYFRAKQDILSAMLLGVFDAFDRAADAVTETEPGPRFRALLRGHFEVIASQPRLNRVSIQEHRHLPEPAATVYRHRRDAYHRRLVDAYAEAARARTVQPVDPEVAVWLLVGSANYLPQWYDASATLGADDLAALAERLLFAGYGANPGG